MNEKEKFVNELRKSLEQNTFVKLQFGKYRGDDRDFQKITVTKINVKEGERLSFNFKYTTKDIVKNFETQKGVSLSGEILGNDFLSGTLFTTENDFTLDHSRKRIPSLHKKKPTFRDKEPAVHNREKVRIADPSAEYFRLLGISTAEGTVRSGMYDKFRQVDKFIETMDSLFRSSGLNEKDEIRITDMGSGKSYLTFALYDHFLNKLNKKVTVTGIEKNSELAGLSNKISWECGYEGLVFKSGSIEEAELGGTDIAVALHACDTATDDAINKAVRAEASIIILAPCCQKYVRKKMRVPENLRGIFGHGIHEERLAVMLTDGLRALSLESKGYSVKIFEFISSEHTARNTMITAVKGNQNNNEAENEITQIRKEFSIDDFYLDKILNK
ncbi:MAG: SAM-dependent methyltransferase [Bacteroidetes bacterium]|nr:SAM-dependent methyltransferase [Bacteroidota bacterium]